MNISNNIFGFTAAILTFLALVISVYTSYSEDMNDGVYNTPSYLVEIVTHGEIDQSNVGRPEMTPITFSFFDEDKRKALYSISFLIILISNYLCIKAFRKQEHSLYYSTAALFSLASFSTVNKMLFVGYFFIVAIYAYYNKNKM